MKKLLLFLGLSLGLATSVCAEGLFIAKGVSLTETDNPFFVRLNYKDKMSVDVPADFHLANADMLNLSVSALASKLTNKEIEELKLDNLKDADQISVGFVRYDDQGKFLASMSVYEWTKVLQYGQKDSKDAFSSSVYKEKREAGIEKVNNSSGAKVEVVEHNLVKINKNYTCMKLVYHRSFSADDEYERKDQTSIGYRCLNYDKSFDLTVSYSKDFEYIFEPIVERIANSVELK